MYEVVKSCAELWLAGQSFLGAVVCLPLHVLLGAVRAGLQYNHASCVCTRHIVVGGSVDAMSAPSTAGAGIVHFTGFWLRSASFVLLLVRVGSGARPFAVLRVRCFRWDSASITERCYCAVIPVAIRVTTMGTRVNLARSGRKALVTKFVGSACYLRRTTPRASGWFFCSQISTVIGSVSYVRCNTPIALEERPRLHVA